MQVIPVLDVRGGRVVHARRGARERYRPVSSRLAPGADPLRLARAFARRLGLRSLYVADLDAIAGAAPDLDLVRRLRACAPDGVWVDAGAADVGAARALLAAGAGRAVIGLETLPDREALRPLTAAVPPGRLVFSLDVRGDRVATAAADFRDASPEEALAAAVEAGFETAIVLDLARVGSAAGPPSALLGRLRGLFPRVQLLAGGGVRDAADLGKLARIGCAGALVATALHEGRIGRAELAAPGGTPAAGD